MAHKFTFYNAGGVAQARFATGADLLAIGELDRKLWTALAMPVEGVGIDAATLRDLDSDADGRIRQPDVVDAAEWLKGAFEPGIRYRSAPTGSNCPKSPTTPLATPFSQPQSESWRCREKVARG